MEEEMQPILLNILFKEPEIGRYWSGEGGGHQGTYEVGKKVKVVFLST